MALGMEVKTAEDLIFRAISDIRQNSKRPDKESIVLHLTTSKGIGLVTQLILNTVDKLIENQRIFIKKQKKEMIPFSYPKIHLIVDRARIAMKSMNLPLPN